MPSLSNRLGTDRSWSMQLFSPLRSSRNLKPALLVFMTMLSKPSSCCRFGKYVCACPHAPLILLILSASPIPQHLLGQSGQLLDRDYSAHCGALQAAVQRCRQCSRELSSRRLTYVRAVSELNEEYFTGGSWPRSGSGNQAGAIARPQSDPVASQPAGHGHGSLRRGGGPSAAAEAVRLRAVSMRLGPGPPPLVNRPPDLSSIDWRYPPRSPPGRAGSEPQGGMTAAMRVKPAGRGEGKRGDQSAVVAGQQPGLVRGQEQIGLMQPREGVRRQRRLRLGDEGYGMAGLDP